MASNTSISVDFDAQGTKVVVYSAFVGPDHSFSFYWRFDTLSARVILAIRDEVTKVDADLEKIAEENSRKNHKIDNEHQHPDGMNVRGHPSPAERDGASVKIWLHNNQQAIAKEETAYTERRDLLALILELRGALRPLLELWSPIRTCSMWTEDRPKLPFYVQQDIHAYSDQRPERVSNAAITGIIFFIVVVPL
ncbi:hypothetical protein BJY01DRAFT_244833 [Aspergillus pseudoustus]|uniref:GOLD domain-containing protein n=1 Tax=Aspergillus pseudoustus TaxID=1810923 RepID=A0ABR4KHZ1_9EURO